MTTKRQEQKARQEALGSDVLMRCHKCGDMIAATKEAQRAHVCKPKPFGPRNKKPGRFRPVELSD